VTLVRARDDEMDLLGVVRQTADAVRLEPHQPVDGRDCKAKFSCVPV
jgi:hypothetical protein